MRTKAAAVLAGFALSGAAAVAQTVQYQVYTLALGDSPASTVGGILFDGQYIWAAIQNPDGGVLEKLTPSGTVVSTTGVGYVPDSLAYDGANAWVTNYEGGTVSVVSSSGQLLTSIAIPGSPSTPEGIAFDGQNIWVANDSGANSVTKINAKSRSIVGTYTVGRAPDALAFDGRYIWVANSESGAVWVLNPETGKPVNGYAVGEFATNLLYDGTNMWVSNGIPPSAGLGSVQRIRAADGGNQATFTVGKAVRGLAYDGRSIWACNSLSNTVSRLGAPNVTLMGTFPTGLNPRAAAFDGTKIWIANSGQNTVTIIVPPEFLAKFQGAANNQQFGSPKVITQPAPPTPAASLTGVFHLLVDDQ